MTEVLSESLGPGQGSEQRLSEQGQPRTLSIREGFEAMHGSGSRLQCRSREDSGTEWKQIWDGISGPKTRFFCVLEMVPGWAHESVHEARLS